LTSQRWARLLEAAGSAAFVSSGADILDAVREAQH
jgi:hypothetical protein